MNDNLKIIEGGSPIFRQLVAPLDDDVKNGRYHSLAFVGIEKETGLIITDFAKMSGYDLTSLLGAIDVLKAEILDVVRTGE